MAVFGIAGQQATLTSTAKTFASITQPASSMRRAKIFDINVSQGAAPASTDTNIVFQLERYTSAGTSTSATPVPADPADGAAVTIGGVNHTIEPTGKAAVWLFQIMLNQRAPYRWQTYLGSGAELVLAATANNGGSFETYSAGYTGTAGGMIYYQEQ